MPGAACGATAPCPPWSWMSPSRANPPKAPDASPTTEIGSVIVFFVSSRRTSGLTVSFRRRFSL